MVYIGTNSFCLKSSTPWSGRHQRRVNRKKVMFTHEFRSIFFWLSAPKKETLKRSISRYTNVVLSPKRCQRNRPHTEQPNPFICFLVCFLKKLERAIGTPSSDWHVCVCVVQVYISIAYYIYRFNSTRTLYIIKNSWKKMLPYCYYNQWWARAHAQNKARALNHARACTAHWKAAFSLSKQKAECQFFVLVGVVGPKLFDYRAAARRRIAFFFFSLYYNSAENGSLLFELSALWALPIAQKKKLKKRNLLRFGSEWNEIESFFPTTIGHWRGGGIKSWRLSMLQGAFVTLGNTHLHEGRGRHVKRLLLALMMVGDWHQEDGLDFSLPLFWIKELATILSNKHECEHQLPSVQRFWGFLGFVPFGIY